MKATMGWTMRACGACLAILLAQDALGQAAAVYSPDRRDRVELVSIDQDASRITIRTSGGSSTLAVEPAAGESLAGLRPGDRIEIVTRDGGRERVVTAIVRGTEVAQQPALGADAVRVRRMTGDPVEIVSVDRAAGKIFVRSEGEQRTFVVDPAAFPELPDVRPGEKVLLSWRFNKQARPEAVVRVVPESSAIVVGGQRVRVAAPRLDGPALEVVVADRASGMLTVRDRSGERVVPLADSALGMLSELSPGDSVVLTWDDAGRVVTVVRR
jgi:hypothetical protein